MTAGAAKTAGESRGPLSARIAWYALLAVPALVPLTIGKLPYTEAAFSQNAFTYPRIFIFALLVTVAFVAWAYAVVRGGLPVRSVPLGWWLAGFLGLGAASTAFALSPAMAFFGGRYNLVGYMVILLTAGAFVLLTQLLDSPARVRALAWSAVGAGTVVAIVTLLQSRDLDPLGMARTNLYLLHRGPSLLGNADFTGTYLVVPMLLAGALALSSKGRSRLVGSCCFGVTFLAVVVSLTRGAWVGAAVGIVALAVSAVRARMVEKKTLAVLILALGSVVVLAVALRGPATFAGRFADLSSVSSAGEGRFTLWGDAVRVIGEHPLLGTGADSYRLGWYPVRSPESVRLSGVLSTTEDPHNVVLLLLATLGIPAGVLGTGLVVAALVKGGRTALARGGERGRVVYAGWWAALAGLLAGLSFSANTVVATATIAVAAGVLAAPSARASQTAGGRVRLLPVAGAVGAGLILVLSAVGLTADIRLAAAMASGDTSGIEDAAGIAPWHLMAQQQAAFAAATDALSRLQSGSPDGRKAADDAERRIAELIRWDPHEYYGYGIQAYFLGQRGAIEDSDEIFRRALAAADRALEIHRASPEAAYLKAFAQASLGEEAAAMRTLEPLWDLDPLYSKAGVLYADLLAKNRDREGAGRVIEVLGRRFPSDKAVLGLERALETSGTAK